MQSPLLEFSSMQWGDSSVGIESVRRMIRAEALDADWNLTIETKEIEISRDVSKTFHGCLCGRQEGIIETKNDVICI